MRIPILRGTLLGTIITFILFALFLNFYNYLVFLSDMRYYQPPKYIGVFEKIFCQDAEIKNKLVQSSGKCPTEGIITALKYSSISVTLWQYLNILVAAKTTRLSGFIPGCMKDMLDELFDNISLPLLSEVGHCPLQDPTSEANFETFNSTQQTIVLSKSSDLHRKDIMNYLDDVRRHFQFTASMKNLAWEYLQAAKQNRTGNVTYIGLYIQDTKIIVNQNGPEIYPDVQFFLNAMESFRKEYPNAVFIVLTDRPKFWGYVFGKKDVYLLQYDSLKRFGSSLAILAHCNHTILASNEIAIWGAILSGGRAIVSCCLFDEYIFLTEYQVNWISLHDTLDSENKSLQYSL